MLNKFLYFGFGENFIWGNGLEMIFCDFDLIEWSYIYELFICIGIVLVVFSCVGNFVVIIFIVRNFLFYIFIYMGIVCLVFCDLIVVIFRFFKFWLYVIYIIINGCVNKG